MPPSTSSDPSSPPPSGPEEPSPPSSPRPKRVSRRALADQLVAVTKLVEGSVPSTDANYGLVLHALTRIIQDLTVSEQYYKDFSIKE